MLFELFYAMKSGNSELLKTTLTLLLLSLPIILLALCVHETAHGFVAKKLGDPTAKYMGRLTLNPLKHLDPFGFLAMLCFGFGWAKPVPIDTRYFKKPRRDMAICALAGPVSNILLAFVFALLYKLTHLIATENIIALAQNEALLNVVSTVLDLFSIGIMLNISLAVFNLLPIPPLDGSKVLYMFLSPSAYFKVLQYERYITYGFFFYLLIESFLPIQIVSLLIDIVSGAILDLFNLILFF